VVGIETFDDGLAVVEAHRWGATLRQLLDAAGRLPPEVAARIAADAAAALAGAHAADRGDGHPLVHGAVGPETISVAEDGAGFVAAFAVVGGDDPAADVRALGAMLHEALTGDAPRVPVRPLDVPGIPSALAAVVDRALGIGSGAPLDTASGLVGALSAATPLADRAAVASYAQAILPAARGPDPIAAVSRPAAPAPQPEEVSAELVVEQASPAPVSGHSSPTAPEAARVFPAPPPAARRSAAPLAVALACGVIGFVIGFALSQRASPRSLPGEPPPAPAAADAHAEPAPEPLALALSPDPAAESGSPPAPVARRRAPSPPVARAEKELKVPVVARPPKVPKREGLLDVTAPPDAEVFLDGRRLGAGNVQRRIPEGSHRIEVRRGDARVTEAFTLVAGETWTYAVTPTPAAATSPVSATPTPAATPAAAPTP
jgi:hypothetical protein